MILCRQLLAVSKVASGPIGKSPPLVHRFEHCWVEGKDAGGVLGEDGQSGILEVLYIRLKVFK